MKKEGGGGGVQQRQGGGDEVRRGKERGRTETGISGSKALLA